MPAAPRTEPLPSPCHGDLFNATGSGLAEHTLRDRRDLVLTSLTDYRKKSPLPNSVQEATASESEVSHWPTGPLMETRVRSRR